MTNSQKKTMWITLAVVLVMFIAFGMISSVTAGFTDFEAKDPVVNEDNFFADATIELKDSNDGYGVRVDVEESTGAVTLNGTASQDRSDKLATVTLDKGTYTLEACDKASLAGIYVTATVGDKVVNFDFTPNNVLEITADDTVVTITIEICEDTQLNNVKVRPVIYTGDESVKFYG